MYGLSDTAMLISVPSYVSIVVYMTSSTQEDSTVNHDIVVTGSFLVDARSNIHHFPIMRGVDCDADSMGQIHRYWHVHSRTKGLHTIYLSWILPCM